MADPRRHDDPAPLAGAARRARAPARACSRSPSCSTGPGSPRSRSRAAAASTRRCGAASRARGSGSARCATAARRRSAMALRGRFLVGSRPLSGDLVRRFIASAAGQRHRRLPHPRPAQRPREPERGGRGHPRSGERSSPIGLVHSPGPAGATDALLERAAAPERARARRASSSTIRPARSTRPARASWSSGSARRAALPVGLHAQGAGGAALAAAIEAARAGGDRDRVRDLPGRALALPRLGARRSPRSLAGHRHRHRASTSTASGRRASSWTTRSARSPCRRSRRASPCAPPSTAFRPASSRSSTPTSARAGLRRPPRRRARAS